MGLAFHKKSEVAESLVQLNLDSFKFRKLWIYISGPYCLCKYDLKFCDEWYIDTNIMRLALSIGPN
jgi:hypothetical protein